MDLKNLAQKRICVAISGGVDSVVLLHYLKTQAAACGFSVFAVHCEHGLRGESSLADMRFVDEFCGKLGVPLTVFRGDCPAMAQEKKMSLETAARAFRRECFAAIIADGKADLVATAHHLLDEAETVLFRLARGTSLSGAKGMTEQDGYIIRPLLTWSKTEILAYAEGQGLSFRVDESNLETEFTRNKLRLEVLPKLEEAVPGACRNLAAFALRAAEDDGVLYELAEGLVSSSAEGVLVAFCNKAPIFRRAVLLALKRLGVEKDYTALHLSAAFDLQGLERGAKLDLPCGIEAVKTERGVLLRKKTQTVFAEKGESCLFGFSGFDGGRYEVIVSATPISHPNLWGRVLQADGDKLLGGVFRFREDGDKMKRFGGGTKTLKKVFNEEKIAVEEREYIPVIAKGSQVLAVCGVEIAEEVKVTEHTTQIVYLATGVKKA